MSTHQWSTATVPGGVGFARPFQWHPCGGWEGERARKDPTKSFTRPLGEVCSHQMSEGYRVRLVDVCNGSELSICS